MSHVATPAAEPPIRTTRLQKAYDGREVLSNVSLTVEPGQVLGLIGRNGAGKSTLIRCLLGLTEPDGGTAQVWGERADTLGDAAKQRLGYVPQEAEAMGWMTPRQMLEFVGRFYPGWDDDYVRDFLARARLPARVPLSRLSPGERQHVAIARALAARPELLVLDEPAASLDPVARRGLLREIVERGSESGCTVLFSTHIVSDLERVASHVAFLHEGRIVLHAELDALKERHLRVHVPAEIAANLERAIPGRIAYRPCDDGSARLFLLPEPGAPRPALLDAPGVRCDRVSLEDLFVEISQ
jgi:ABC-2 type transport system ATP-binding protein